MSRRRVLACFALLVFPLGAVEARFFWLQVLRGEKYREEAETKVTQMEVIPTGRGRILDRNGVVLAQDDRTFQVDLVLAELRVPRMTPAEVRSLVRVASEELARKPELALQALSMSRLARMFGVPREMLETAIEYAQVLRTIKALGALAGDDWQRLYAKVDVAYRRISRLIAPLSSRDARRVARYQRELPIRLLPEVGYDIASEIRVSAERYPGLVVTERLRRVYPQAETGSHVVGYVGKLSETQYRELEHEGYFSNDLIPIIGEEEYRRKERHGQFMADVIGKAGIEAQYNETLKGTRGAMITERDLFHQHRRILEHVPPSRGRDIHLTIDIEIQKKIEAVLGRKPTVAAVCDVATGEILALVSTPTFDPNELISPVTPEAYEAIFKSPDRPLLNRATMGEYPLGSVFKVVTGLAALRSGAIGPDTPITCTGKYDEKVKRFNCWIWNKNNGQQHGPLMLAEALQRSCNVFFFHAATRTGVEPFLDMAREAGFGRLSGIDLPTESQGGLPSPASVPPNELLNLAIGQGRLIVTPVQVLRLMLALANGGTLAGFRLNRDVRAPAERLDVPDAHLDRIREGLYLVVNAKQGTAHKSGLWKYRAAGKTSTADVASAAAAAANPRLQPHAWFAGFAPYRQPKYAFVVLVEHGGAGSKIAAPLALKILEILGLPEHKGESGDPGEPSEDSGD